MRWRPVVGALVVFLLFIGTNFTTQYRAEQERAKSVQENIEVTCRVRRAVALGQEHNEKTPLVIPEGSPPFVADLLTQAHNNSKASAKIILDALGDASQCATQTALP